MAVFFSERVEDRVVTLTFRMPEYLNSYDLEMLAQFREAVVRLSEREDIRVLILNGVGSAFCCGARLRFILDCLRANELRSVRRLSELTREVLFLLRRVPQFSIASVDGLAVDGGFNLALACDHVVSSDRALFGYPFIQVGLSPDVGTSSLFASRIGSSKALRLLLSGRLYSATAVRRMGLIQDVATIPNLNQRTLTMAGWASRLPAVVVRGLKRNLYSKAEVAGPHLEAEVETRLRCFLSDDFREGIEAFNRNRSAKFRGQ